MQEFAASKIHDASVGNTFSALRLAAFMIASSRSRVGDFSLINFD